MEIKELIDSQKDNLLIIYKNYLDSLEFKDRKFQFGFVPLAKEIISLTIQDELTNDKLTGLIQMLRNGSAEQNFVKYSEICFKNELERKQIQKKYNELKKGQTGYTGKGKAAVIGLNKIQLEEVRQFLLNIKQTDNINDIKSIISKFEKKNIPEVKSGVYSPWLYYLKPTICPILNNDPRKTLKSIGWDGSYNQALEIFNHIKNILNIEEHGLIDGMIFFYNKYANESIFISDTTRKNNIEPKKILDNMDNMKDSLNLILYGPPGTGKTYNTKRLALKLIAPEEYANCINNDEEINKLYDKYKENEQILFVTFHQAMTYEDFIEGIKPTISEEVHAEENNVLNYTIQDGIFKIISENAINYKQYEETKDTFEIDDKILDKASFFKMSLGDSTDSEDEPIYNFCIENNCIALGYGRDINYEKCDTLAKIKTLFKEKYPDDKDFNITAIERFKLWMKKDDIVLVSNGVKKIRAIGIITGDYEYNEKLDIRYNHFRKVKWLKTDIATPIKEVYSSNFSMQTIYMMFNDKISRDFFKGKKQDKRKDFALIIDEINRGNISSIFGELITLIEKDKRLGMPEELKAKLPYSKKEFGVPPNLYIIGTMNTADRSVEALDTALRRRFVFKEFMPKPYLIALLSDKTTK